MAINFPQGYLVGSAVCGIRAATLGNDLEAGDREDLTVLLSARLCDAGGVFTTNQIKSASVLIDQHHLITNRVRALVVCSGNANACTGHRGFSDVEEMTQFAAEKLRLDPQQVLVGTTGVIGRYLPMEVVRQGIAAACSDLSPEGGDRAAKAIMTTDTVPKTAAMEIELDGVKIRVGGMAKGSGMIHPNMATMLAYITTDAAVEPGWVGKVVKRIADRSFNQVSVDGDCSTNDTFLILANGSAGNVPITSDTPASEQLEAAITKVARSLTRQIAADGEGASKLITVRVTGAVNELQARQAARAVASSTLVKAAIHGGDPNWGRILCALGASGAEVLAKHLQVEVAGILIFAQGAGWPVNLATVRQAFEQSEIEIVADLGLGAGRGEAWGCDLSPEYVRINAEYTT